MHTLKPGWKMVKFGDVVRQCKEKVDRSNNPFQRYIEGGHIDSEDIHIRRWGEFGSDYVGPAFHRIFRKGQVLYGSRRTYLKKVAVADFDGITANTTFVCETKDQNIFMQELLPFLMLTESFTNHSIRESKGSTNPYINWPDIAKYEFPLPPLEEQKRLAELLWAADDAVEKYHYAFLELISLLEHIREYRICSSSYPWKKFKHIITRITAGKSITGINIPATEDEFGVLKVSAISKDGFKKEENKRISKDDFIDKYSIKKDSLLITRCNTAELVGAVCIVQDNYDNLMLCDKTLQIDLDEQKTNKNFICEVLKTRHIRMKIAESATGTSSSMKNITQNDIRSLLIPLPEKYIQDKIYKEVDMLYSKLELVKKHIYKIVNMQKLIFNQVMEYHV